VVLVNGTPADAIGAGDRGLHYGDGLFETFAVCDGRPLCWEAHLARLSAGCRRLRLPQPDVVRLREEAGRACDGLAIGVLKLIVTRGPGGRGYAAPATVQPTRILLRYPWPAHPPADGGTGVRVRVCDTRLGGNPALAGIKHLNRLEQVLARSEWDDPDIAEGLMLDEGGWVVEGTMSNLFMVSRGRLLTPSLERSGIAGVMRRLILAQAAALGLPAAEASLGLDDLQAADEIFLSNSVIGIWPVRELAGRVFKVGPVAGRLTQALAERGHLARAPG
jgi:4-amino-4-deoxychorismate lyase